MKRKLRGNGQDQQVVNGKEVKQKAKSNKTEKEGGLIIYFILAFIGSFILVFSLLVFTRGTKEKGIKDESKEQMVQLMDEFKMVQEGKRDKRKVYCPDEGFEQRRTREIKDRYEYFFQKMAQESKALKGNRAIEVCSSQTLN